LDLELDLVGASLQPAVVGFVFVGIALPRCPVFDLELDLDLVGASLSRPSQQKTAMAEMAGRGS